MISIITYVVSTLFTYIMGILSKQWGWNEELPIPVQNILIGIFVFAISIFYLQLTKQEINLEILAEQVIVALGGSGSATLYYDTKKIGE